MGGQASLDWHVKMPCYWLPRRGPEGGSAGFSVCSGRCHRLHGRCRSNSFSTVAFFSLFFFPSCGKRQNRYIRRDSRYAHPHPHTVQSVGSWMGTSEETPYQQHARRDAQQATPGCTHVGLGGWTAQGGQGSRAVASGLLQPQLVVIVLPWKRAFRLLLGCHATDDALSPSPEEAGCTLPSYLLGTSSRVHQCSRS